MKLTCVGEVESLFLLCGKDQHHTDVTRVPLPIANPRLCGLVRGQHTGVKLLSNPLGNAHERGLYGLGIHRPCRMAELESGPVRTKGNPGKRRAVSPRAGKFKETFSLAKRFA